jgi:hypothetical protein
VSVEPIGSMASVGATGGGRPAMIDWERFYSRLREPDFIPGFEILERLGGGAFGEVYRARKRSIGKDYAVKFLRLDEASLVDGGGQGVERELDYAAHFAAIDHPNLVTIEDVGQAAGVPYLLMGYAGEETLASRLAQGSLPADETLRLFVQVCRGTLALHDRRLAHFDLKPSNVFLKGEVARVGDYGLAKLLSEGRQTLSFGRGTPRYMAPEILRGRADHRADIYSLGVLLYECVAGKPPFEPESGIGVPIRDDDTPPEFGPGFPQGLRRAVERCLRLDPQERYASVAELLEDLGQTARPGDSVAWSRAPLEAPEGEILEVAGVHEPDGGDTSPLQGGDAIPGRTAAWSDRDLGRDLDRDPGSAAGRGFEPAGSRDPRFDDYLSPPSGTSGRGRLVPVPPAAAEGPVSTILGLGAVTFDLARWLLLRSLLGLRRVLGNTKLMAVLIALFAASLALALLAS